METKELNSRFLDSSIILPGRVNIIKSICGTGKTRAIRNYLETLPSHTSLIVPTFRRTLCGFLTGEFENVSSYLSCHSRIIDPHSYPRVCISPESFWRYRDDEGACPIPDVLILDEICSLFEHVLNTSTIKGEQRSYFIHVISLFLKQPSCTTIICDAYFSKEDMSIVKMMVEDESRIQYVVNHYCEKKYKLYIYSKSIGSKWWKHMFQRAASNEDKKIYVFSSSKKLLLGLETEYSSNKYNEIPLDTWTEDAVGDKRRIISADSSDAEKELYSSQPDSDDSWSTNRILYVSPTIQAGVSFTKEYFNVSFGAAVQGCGSVNGFVQQMMRTRNIVDKEIHVFLPTAMSKLSKHKISFELDEKNIWDRLEVIEKWTNMKITQLIEKDLTIVDKRVAIRPTVKSILNHILVVYAVKAFKQKQNYIKAFKELLMNDWYEIIDVDEEVFNTLKGDDTVVQKNIIDTYVKGNDYLLKMFNNNSWEGEWPDDERLKDMKGGAFDQLMEFIDFWGVLGVLGETSQLHMLHFNTNRLSLFYLKLANNEQQSRFSSFLLKDSVSLLVHDMEENQYNSMSYDTILYSSIALLFESLGILKARKVTCFTNSDIHYFDDRTYEPVGPRKEFIMDEYNLNNQEVFERLCDMLSTSYFHIVKTLNINLSTVDPSWLKDRLICTRALKDIRKIVDGALKYMGLKRDNHKIDEERVDVFYKSRLSEINSSLNPKVKYVGRIRVRRYIIEGMRVRILITFCRLFKNNSRGLEHPNNIIPDPLLLLDWSKKQEHIPSYWDHWHGSHPNPFHYRFWILKEAYYNEDWANTVKTVWGKANPNQLYIMTNDNNILKRYEYWNPMVTPNKFLEDLPQEMCQPESS